MTEKQATPVNYFVLFLLGTFILTVLFFAIIPISGISPRELAFDWIIGVHGAIWKENFGWGFELHAPPWAVVPFLLPISALPFNLGWALMMALTTVALMFTILQTLSRRRLQPVGALLLFTAYPVIRNYADLNLEAYVILGLLLAFYAFRQQNPYLLALGVLIATIKPQNVFILMIVMGIYILKTFSLRNTVIFGAITGSIVLISLLIWGDEWLPSLTELPSGNSLGASFGVLAIPTEVTLGAQLLILGVTLFFVLKDDATLSPLKIGLLITASVLMAPYSNLTSLVSVLALGGMALLQSSVWLCVLIFILMNLPYLSRLSLIGINLDTDGYITFCLLVMWAILLIRFLQTERHTAAEATIA